MNTLQDKIKTINKITNAIYYDVKIGDVFETVAGSFEILEIWFSDYYDDYEAKCLWTVYNEDGTVYDQTRCVLTFEDIADYLKYNYTDNMSIYLLYSMDHKIRVKELMKND